MKRVRVVGAGLSGLAAAAALVDRGWRVTVVDRASEPGGLIRTRRTPHGPVEQAAHAFIWDTTVARWFARLGIDPSFARPAARRRYILARGRPRRWPLGAGGTASLAWHAAAAWLTGRLDPREDETVERYARRIAGAAAARSLIGPALQGVYASPPDRLSADLIFAARKRRRGRRRSAAPPGGMGEFIERLHAYLVGRGVSFDLGRDADPTDLTEPVVVCTNVRDAARFVEARTPGLGQVLVDVPMTSIVSVTAFFAPDPADLQGFGVLFPRDSGVLALGCLWNTCIFEGRGTDRSETWIYGDTDPARLPNDSQVVEQVVRDRARATGSTASPLACHATRIVNALPVYGPSVVAVRRHLPCASGGAVLCGNYLGRLGAAGLLAQAEDVPDLLDSAATPV